MKFTDGYWQIRKGMTPYFPAQVYEVEVEPGAMMVYAATKKLVTRGDTLGIPMLTVRFSTPMENVIRVQMSHHKGGLPRKPEFVLSEQPHPQPVISDNEQCATLTSGALSVRVQKSGNWLVEYKAGERVITSSTSRGMGLVDAPEGRYIHEQLNIGVGECI
jgi:alpha-D-xyloside xylohydrolase